MREVQNNKIVEKTWRLRLSDVAWRFKRRGWSETEAEVLSSKDHRKNWYLPNNLIDNQPSLDGWLVAFRYFVDKNPYDGVLFTRNELKEGEKFTIRYNPAHPDQNDSLAAKLDWLSNSMLWTYFYRTVLLIVASALASVFVPH
jgi:hypothetical protein